MAKEYFTDRHSIFTEYIHSEPTIKKLECLNSLAVKRRLAHKEILYRLPPLRTNSTNLNQRKYCSYHRLMCHDIEMLRHKKGRRALIRKGRLCKFVSQVTQQELRNITKLMFFLHLFFLQEKISQGQRTECQKEKINKLKVFRREWSRYVRKAQNQQYHGGSINWNKKFEKKYRMVWFLSVGCQVAPRPYIDACVITILITSSTSVKSLR